MLTFRPASRSRAPARDRVPPPRIWCRVAHRRSAAVSLRLRRGELHLRTGALVDPRDCLVRYVRQSSDPRRRLSTHLSRARHTPTSAAHQWLNELLAAGLRPQLAILQEVRDARPMAERAVMEAGPFQRAEQRWIARYQATVLNHDFGRGDGSRPDYVHFRQRGRQARTRQARARGQEG
jgi:hypothetical protein